MTIDEGFLPVEMNGTGQTLKNLNKKNKFQNLIMKGFTIDGADIVNFEHTIFKDCKFKGKITKCNFMQPSERDIFDDNCVIDTADWEINVIDNVKDKDKMKKKQVEEIVIK